MIGVLPSTKVDRVWISPIVNIRSVRPLVLLHPIHLKVMLRVRAESIAGPRFRSMVVAACGECGATPIHHVVSTNDTECISGEG
jgi:hypothetical protein